MLSFVRAALLATLAGWACAQPARAADDAAGPAPALTVTVRDTAEVWRNLRGGAGVGYTTLDKLQLNTTLDGDAFGRPGFKAHASAFRTNSQTLSASRTGDLQTVSNIEAPGVSRLFELWASQSFGTRSAGGLDARLGLIDINDTFDAIAPAGLFLNSSQGIGPDISRGGPNGPSIFPVSSAGLHLGWTPSEDLAVHAAVLDGVPGDPARPEAFAAVRLSGRDGALLIAQLDRRLAGDGQASIGVWTYTAPQARLAAPGQTRDARPGVYAFVEGPLEAIGRARAWVRAGVADGRVQAVSGYLGAGVVWQGVLRSRPQDRFGVAVGHAVVAPAARRLDDLPVAETTWEATYSVRLSDALHLQPDLQYIVHPSGAPRLRNALAIGLRIVAEIGVSSR